MSRDRPARDFFQARPDQEPAPRRAAPAQPSGRFAVALAGSPRLRAQALQLARLGAGGAPAGRPATAVVQRVRTPDLPTGALAGVDLASFNRNYLLTLKWQLVANRQRGSAEMVDVDRLLALAETGTALDRAELDTLIQRVNALTPGATASVGAQPVTLNATETGDLKGLLGKAAARAAGVAGNAAVLAQVFGRESAAAAAKFQEIDQHLQGWSTDVNTRATIDRSGQASFTAFNIGSGAASRLTVTPSFQTNPEADVIGTLIHEASHGACGTLDLAYTSAPYFTRLQNGLALANADHFAYAAQLHAGGAALPAVANAAVANRSQAFERAASLCHFKCKRVMPLLLWLVDGYSGKARNLHGDTIDLHEDRMGLGGRTTKTVPDPQSSSWLPDFLRPKVRQPSDMRANILPICKERTQMLHDVIDVLAMYIAWPRQLAEIGGQIEVQPVHGGNWPTLRYPVDVADDVNVLAKRIFVTTLQDFSFNALQAERMFDWSDALFQNVMKDDVHKSWYAVNAEMVELHRILLS